MCVTIPQQDRSEIPALVDEFLVTQCCSENLETVLCFQKEITNITRTADVLKILSQDRTAIVFRMCASHLSKGGLEFQPVMDVFLVIWYYSEYFENTSIFSKGN